MHNIDAIRERIKFVLDSTVFMMPEVTDAIAFYLRRDSDAGKKRIIRIAADSSMWTLGVYNHGLDKVVSWECRSTFTCEDKDGEFDVAEISDWIIDFVGVL